MKSASTASSSFRSGMRSIAVRCCGFGWAIYSATNEGLSHFPTQAQAIAAAKRSLARQGGVLSIHSANGTVRETLTLGRDAAVRLNGIEGLEMTTASRRLLRDVQASGMTPSQQRSAISAAFKR